MRYLIAAIAIAPFLVLLVAMATGRATVHGCCAPMTPTTPPDHSAIETENGVEPRV